MSSFFSLHPTVPLTCSAQIVTWNKTRYHASPKIRVLIPGGQATKLDLDFSDSWEVNVRNGTQIAFFLESSLGVADSRTSPLLTVNASSSQTGNDCLLALGELKSTVTLLTDTPVSTVTASTTALPMSTMTASITGLPESTKKSECVTTSFPH